MPAFFLDSSALVKGYRREQGTERVQELLRGPHRLVISQLSHLEVTSAITRRGAQSVSGGEQIQRALSELDREVLESFDVIAVDESLLAMANRLVRAYRLRAANSIQLAAVLIARQRLQEELLLLSADVELNAAALAEGIQVENPNLRA